MKYSLGILLSMLSLAALLCSCDRPKTISDDELVDIFHDAYLANAYLNTMFIESDSMLIYEPIVERYGYSMEDLRHSIQTFSERKSALLSDLVAKTFRKLEAESKAEARKVVILDTLDRVAQRAYTRTRILRNYASLSTALYLVSTTFRSATISTRSTRIATRVSRCMYSARIRLVYYAIQRC